MEYDDLVAVLACEGPASISCMLSTTTYYIIYFQPFHNLTYIVYCLHWPGIPHGIVRSALCRDYV